MRYVLLAKIERRIAFKVVKKDAYYVILRINVPLIKMDIL